MKYPTVAIQFASRNRQLKKLGFSNYREYLASDYWKSVKQKINKKVAEGNTYWNHCKVCGSDKNIHLHHFRYGNMKNPTLTCLYPLCQSCHYQTHEYIKLHPEASLKTGVRKFSKSPKQNVKSGLTERSL